jgi:hypothetical protein
MKAFAHRPRDLEDLRKLLVSHPDIGLDEVRSNLKEFAEALDEPVIVDDFERIVRDVLGPGR